MSVFVFRVYVFQRKLTFFLKTIDLLSVRTDVCALMIFSINTMKINSERVIEEARRWIGTPYHHQASLCGVGCDCLGLLRGIRRSLGGEDPEYIPPYTPRGESSEQELEQALSGYFKRCSSLIYKPGDILVFRWRDHLSSGHVAIASMQDEKAHWMIHAHSGISVSEVPIHAWWRRHLASVFMFSIVF